MLLKEENDSVRTGNTIYCVGKMQSFRALKLVKYIIHTLVLRSEFIKYNDD